MPRAEIELLSEELHYPMNRCLEAVRRSVAGGLAASVLRGPALPRPHEDHSRLAQALAHHACRHGHTALFTKTRRLLADLAGGHADGTWGARLKRCAKPDVLVLDDLAIRAHTTVQHADNS